MPVEDYGPTEGVGLEPLYRTESDGTLTQLCGARKTKKGGDRCKAVAGHGTDHPGFGQCKYHGGSTRVGEVVAARVQIAEKLDEMKRLGVITDQVGPEAALLQEVSRAAAAVAYFDDLVAKIPAEDTWLGPNQVIIQQWNEQRTMLRQTARTIVAAGIAKRQVEIAEMQAKALVQVILAVVGAPEMALNADQQAMARRLVANQLRSMAAIETSAA